MLGTSCIIREKSVDGFVAADTLAHLTTMRAGEKVDGTGFPAGLRSALVSYNRMREIVSYETAERAVCRDPSVERLQCGFRRITHAGAARIAIKHGGVCPVYCRGASSTLRSLDGIFYWTGAPEVRRRLLLLAWRKGASRSLSRRAAQ